MTSSGYYHQVNVSTETRVSVATHATVQPLDDRAVVLNLRTGKCWELNATGLAIWRSLIAGESVGDTAEAIAARYSIHVDVSRQDVVELVRSLIGEGLLVISSAVRSAPFIP
jgi:Coenzyme PQQ synthesis protein D (PqqD)